MFIIADQILPFNIRPARIVPTLKNRGNSPGSAALKNSGTKIPIGHRAYKRARDLK
jgi:hypothetical protein